MDGSSWIVLKFGGTSVSSRQRWETIERVARDRLAEGLRPLIVCSALSGVSDALEVLLELAVDGRQQEVLDRLVAQHHEMADSLCLDRTVIEPELVELERLVLGVSLVEEVSPRLHARVLAHGELLSTKLGAAFLHARGVQVAWVDARTCLTTAPIPHAQEQLRFLGAACDHDADHALAQRLAALPADVLVTQGFIAADPEGGTALLGRGGSDTSAAYFAARLTAARCEIWTDVPGMFSANPKEIPTARLLRALRYDEAQEIASTGAKVLHPRCIPPLREHGIPLHIRCTPHPNIDGTVISDAIRDSGAQVKAVSLKRNITLVSMDTLGMWQQVGFLADIFGVFRLHGLSIDLVSTSEANVTVSLDPSANALDPDVLRALEHDLRAHCRARIIRSAAAISLVGRKIRAIFYQLGPALEVFEEHRIHLVSQAASDLNVTFVVDQEQAARLVRELHSMLFKNVKDSAVLGPSWEGLFAESAPSESKPRWWQRRREELLAAASSGPLYVYDRTTLEAQARGLLGLGVLDQVFYAMKANAHPEVLRAFERLGLGFECVSPGELDHLFATLPTLAPQRVLFTPNFAPRHEYADAFARGVRVNVDNVYALEHWPEVFAGQDIFVRMDPGEGKGAHPYIRTGGQLSKFGVCIDDLEQLVALTRAHGVRVKGLHAHAGSAIQNPGQWAKQAVFLASVASQFPEVEILNLGGGLGVAQKPGQASLDVALVGQSLATVRAAHPRYALWMEPGRFLVAEAGVLLARVTQVKSKGEITYVGIETGMNSLIRPALYGAYHEIVNLTRVGEPHTLRASVVGPICETGDTLGYARELPQTREGDVMLVATAGAYGRVMSSHYNLREPASERVI